MLVAAVLVLMGGLIQINPIWLWGPYHTYLGTNGAQPDWYLGWLIGALRTDAEPRDLDRRPHADPQPVLRRRAVPDRRVRRCSTRCRGSTGASSHATGSPTTCSTVRATIRAAPPSPRAVLSAIIVVFAAGSADRLFVVFTYSYEGAIDFFRIAFFVVPVIVYLVTKRICTELARSERHPLREWSGGIVQRNPAGGFDAVSAIEDEQSGPAGS